MNRFPVKVILLLLAILLLGRVASADSVPIGILSLDAESSSGTSAQFDITNLSGANALPPDFPVLTTLDFSITSLVVNFVTGPSLTLTSANFTSDGFGGFTGDNVFNLGTSPILSAVFTGTLSPTSGITGVSGGSILSGFSATLTDPSGPLVAGDLVVLNATTGSEMSTPERGTLLFLSFGLGLLFVINWRRASHAA